jgi:hypothetical protein
MWIYNGNQGGSPGGTWNLTNSVAYWKLNNAGSVALPTNGTVTSTTTNYNFYVLTNNGIQLGNGTGTALIRNPYSTNTPNVVSFPGDTLILLTNTQLRFKNLGGTGTFVSGANYATPTNIFPGNFGFPGMILDGGCLNNGTSGTSFVIQGSIFAQPGSQSYLNPADTFNQDTVSRGLIFQARLTGSGTIALLNGLSGQTVPVPTPFTATNNNFTGEWIVKSGLLQGNGDGTSDGYNSLGTNPAVVFDIDPQWVPPSGGTSGNFGFSNNPAVTGGGNAYFYNGPAVVDFGPSLVNSGGALMLTNGGQLYMHGALVFSNVWVEGVQLAPGTYTYATLAAMSADFTPPAATYPNQGGTITIQGYGTAAIPALITTQPASEILYPSRTAAFTVNGGGSTPLFYYWYKNSVLLSDSGNISGSSTPTLTIGNVSSSDVATYSVIVSNKVGVATSSNVTLQVVTPVSPYEIAVSNSNPVAYYEFNETNNPAVGNVRAYDYAGGFNGTYGVNVQNGFDNITGPTPSLGFPGFATNNDAIQTVTGTGNQITTPDWNLNTNTVTMIAWIQPNGAQSPSSAIIFCRGANTVAGLNYSGTIGVTGTYDLGYTWNNDVQTYSWDSGLVPTNNQWSMVALSVTPTQATIYIMNTNGLTSSTHVYPHIVQAFDTNNTTQIGEDSNDGGNGTRSFFGQIDDVSIYNYALTGDQIASLFYAATSTTNYPPAFGTQPVASTNVYLGQSFQLFVNAYGSEPLSYQWASGPANGTGPYTPLNDGNGLSGTHTSTLNFQSVTPAQGLNYICIVSNSVTPSGSNSTPATVSVLTPSAPVFNITMSQQEAAGLDWNSTGNWSDGQPASASALSEPGSIYEVLQGARLRTPASTTFAVFPGNELLLDGTGVWINNPAAGTVQGELRLKQTDPLIGLATVTFPLLVMNGGQMDLGNDGVGIVYGVINVLSNGIFYSDSGDDRGYLLNAQLTGTNSIQYFGDNNAYPAGYTNNLDIAATSNTFSGPWLIQAGMLLGSGSNSLGTNNITIASGAVFQTLYNVNDTTATLALSGTMLLSQTDTFYTVFLGTTPLQVGTYSAATLASNYPAYFPSNWVAKFGAPAATNAVGSITVLHTPGPSVLSQPQSLVLYPSQTAVFSVTAGGTPPLTYRWYSNNVPLTDGGIVSGSTNLNLILANTVPADAASYTVVVSNSLSSVTSLVATLTLLPTQPAIIPIQLNVVEPAPDDWNTPGEWNDGQGGLPASLSALEFPGSTYEILPGALMRTPTNVIPYTNFPGLQLTVDGNGVWVDLPTAASPQAEIRFKSGQSGEVVYFPLLIMAGGQLDNGNASTLVDIQGAIDIVSNTPIYADDSGSTGIRGYQIDAYLFGNGSIEYHDSDPSFGGGLNITGNTNAFTGVWNIVQGPLVGTGKNSLGTNNIIIGATGGLETLYNINSPQATLSLSNGAVMYLHQNDIFQAVNVNGVSLAAGTWSFAQLNAAYPTTFPASWNALFTSTFTSGSGSITVGGSGPPPVTLLFSSSPGSLVLTWSQGALLQKTNLLAPWVTNTTATSPYVVNPTNAQQFFKIQVQ